MSLRRLHRVFDRARSGCEHSASFKRVNVQNKHGGEGTIARLLSEKVCLKQFNTIQFLYDGI